MALLEDWNTHFIGIKDLQQYKYYCCPNCPTWILIQLANFIGEYLQSWLLLVCLMSKLVWQGRGGSGVGVVDDDDDYTGPFLGRCMTVITCSKLSLVINLWFCGYTESTDTPSTILTNLEPTWAQKSRNNDLGFIWYHHRIMGKYIFRKRIVCVVCR